MKYQINRLRTAIDAHVFLQRSMQEQFTEIMTAINKALKEQPATPRTPLIYVFSDTKKWCANMTKRYEYSMMLTFSGDERFYLYQTISDDQGDPSNTGPITQPTSEILNQFIAALPIAFEYFTIEIDKQNVVENPIDSKLREIRGSFEAE